ncbi:MAG TPA: HAMP domain-containing methyl-accepting chemotaxis protein [Spirochaetia bacterium]|nr:HAMP domain-containing methyl-accepting chemotaxis protein [Spirochaetia bacterium]
MSFISRLRIGARITMVMTVICAILVFLAVYGLYNLNKTQERVNAMYSLSLVSSQYLANADLNFQELQTAIYAHIDSTDQQQMNLIYGDATGYYANTLSYLKEYQSSGLSAKETQDLSSLQSQLAQYRNTSDELFQESSLGTPAGKAAAYRIIQSETGGGADTITQDFSDLQVLGLERAQVMAAQARNDYDQTRTISMGAALLALLLSAGLGFLLSRSIAKPLRELDSMAGEIARGNLTGNISLTDARDEVSSLSRSVHQMVNNLREFVTQVQESSLVVASSSRQLSDNAEQTSAAASDTAATVSEIAGTMDQMAQNAQEVAAMSEQTSREAENGSRGVERITSQMEAIAYVSHNASTVVDTLSKTLDQVNQIVELITNIANQTNLLALNAAIEAARAGEQGRGFAVVAEEVRKLAEQSANAGKDINQLISKVQSESNKAVQAMSEGAKQVREGTAVTGEVGSSFKGIINLVDGLAQQIQSLAAAAQQVSAGVENVAGAAQNQTSAMQEVSSATGKLAAMADDLNRLVGNYRL